MTSESSRAESGRVWASRAESGAAVSARLMYAAPRAALGVGGGAASLSLSALRGPRDAVRAER